MAIDYIYPPIMRSSGTTSGCIALPRLRKAVRQRASTPTTQSCKIDARGRIQMRQLPPLRCRSARRAR